MQPTSVPGVKKKAGGGYIVDCVKRLDKKRVHIYCSGYETLEEAKADLPRLVAEKKEALAEKKRESASFLSFYERYEEYRLLHVRTSTVHLVRSVVNAHLPKWKEMTVKQVFSYDSLEEAYQTILATSSGPAWKNRACGAIRQMALCAFRWRLIDADAEQDATSILENIPEHRYKKKEKEIWSPREKQRFLDAIDDPTDYLMFSLFIALGARISEFAGLTWDCFDAKKGIIEIKQQLIYEDTGKWVLSPFLKTKESYRRCRLPRDLVERLSAYRENANQRTFIFPSRVHAGEPLSKGAFRRRLKKYIGLAGVKMITPHAIRHEKATDLMRVCRNMQEVKAAARYLGHSATMMIDTYGHYEQLAEQAVLSRLEKEEEKIRQP